MIDFLTTLISGGVTGVFAGWIIAEWLAQGRMCERWQEGYRIGVARGVQSERVRQAKMAEEVQRESI